MTCPAARVEVGVKFAGTTVAVGTLPVAVTEVALKSMIWVGVTVTVSVTEMTGETVGVGVSVSSGAVAVSVTAADVAEGRAVSVWATAVLN